MASILRQIVAGPRSRHPEANLDLCYVTDNIIATSGPSVSYPSLAYRNPLSELVTFLDSKHEDQWCLFEFRAEGCGYPDESVHGRIWHWPWPDHHPPPFALVPKIMGSMRAWLNPEQNPEQPAGDSTTAAASEKSRVAVVHCKAGKGRSGSMAVSYMITHLGWAKEEALQRFTNRRMRPGFGPGLSIPSQRRWIDYVERWASHGQRIYVERRIEIKEVRIWGLRDGVRISIDGYVDNGKKIQEFHVFTAEEREDIEHLELPAAEAASSARPAFTDIVQDIVKRQKTRFSKRSRSPSPQNPPNEGKPASSPSSFSDSRQNESSSKLTDTSATGLSNVVFRPSSPVVMPTSDVNLAIERRTSGTYGFSTLTSIAHVWFNCYFEGAGPENYQNAAATASASQASANKGADAVPGSPWANSLGVFSIAWDAMDGVKGSSRKGVKAFDVADVIWTAAPDSEDAATTTPLGATTRKATTNSLVVAEPAPGDPITPVEAADWHGVPDDLYDSQKLAKIDDRNAALRQEESHTKGEGEGLDEDGNLDEDLDEDGEQGLRRGFMSDPATSSAPPLRS